MKRKRRIPPSDGLPLFDFPIPSNGARDSDPISSQEAAARVASPDLRRFRASSKMAKLLFEFEKESLTDYEATALVQPNDFHARVEGCRRRCSDLRAVGMIENSGEPRRCNAGSPDESIVWKITETGRAAASRLKTTGWSA